MYYCTTEEISTIITELKNGIASDILIYKIPYRLVYKIPYRRAPRLAYRASKGILHTTYRRAPRLAYQPLGRVRHLHTSDIPIHVIKKKPQMLFLLFYVHCTIDI